jgi:hypothetical protein
MSMFYFNNNLITIIDRWRGTCLLKSFLLSLVGCPNVFFCLPFNVQFTKESIQTEQILQLRIPQGERYSTKNHLRLYFFVFTTWL